MYEMIESVYDTLNYKPEEMTEKIYHINGSLNTENISRTKREQQ